MKRALVFTCNFGGYDRIYPPMYQEDGVDYAIFTENPDLHVNGWKTIPVKLSDFISPKSATLFHKALSHRVVEGYDVSISIDGKLRVVSYLKPFLERLCQINGPIAVYSHPGRNTVVSEAAVCIADGKVKDPELLKRQVESYKAEGFPDDVGLFEGAVIFRNHKHPNFERLMEAWWEEFKRWPTREQVSLPVALWRTGVCPYIIPGAYPGSQFHLSPHASRPDVNPTYAHVHAMSATSLFHRAILHLWHAKWQAERTIRHLGNK